MEYNFREIEKKWQKNWKETGVYKVSNTSSRPKFYILDMFPYPSGTGLHVGHPLGYIASDIYARYKRLKGFNVLHPMGYDSFGLPAEQYALETGQHPAVTTENNIETFRQQLDNIGFSFDWSRELRTSDPKFYKWTQWIFLKLFNSYFCNTQQKARPISELIAKYETKGCNHFTSEEWKAFSEKEKSDWLMKRRLAFSAYGEVNWCEALGTVLANDEVINGVSERGGHPVVKRKMRQWYLRITAYAERLLQGLETVDFSDAMKEMQRNWIGKSEGAEIQFTIDNSQSTIKVYTTRPDTIFGVDFMVLAPEHELVNSITTKDQRQSIDEYLTYVKSRSDRERMAEVKQITGCFTGSYALNPFDGRKIPIWIAEYVLAGYGTGAIMAVPCGDQRDFDFAKHFNIPITNIIGEHFNGEEANATKEATLSNSGFLNGIKMKDAIEIVLKKIEEKGIGRKKVNYKMRDAGFSRQRYWGEPFPIIYHNGVAYALDEKDLPVELPYVENYKPGPEGEGPLANITDWVNLDANDVQLQNLYSNLTPGPSPKERGEKPTSFITSDFESWKKLKPFARENRKNKTDAEDILWQEIRNRKINDCKFRRQHAIGGFIVDFVCIEKNLVIEIDGDYHDDAEQKKYDDLRTEYLKENGFDEIRFTNDAVINHISEVLEKIGKALHQSPPLLWRGVRGEVFYNRETNTMPGYAGSSWYFLRYMDPHNDKEFADRKATDYWNQVDVYVGGTEHAVGHLLYSRMWTKVLYDLGLIGFDEPYKKLVNQGMITGKSFFLNAKQYLINESEKIYEVGEHRNFFLAFASLNSQIEFPKKMMRDNQEWIQSNVEFPEGLRLKYAHKYLDAQGRLTKSQFEKYMALETGIMNPIYGSGPGPHVNWENEEKTESDEPFLSGLVIEKMSKSKFNVESPYIPASKDNEGNIIEDEDGLVVKYGADTFRMYEMFLGPVEASKPWDTKGIEGVHRFLKKLWRLFFDDAKGKVWNDENATDSELKILHKAIKKIEEDTERFSYNTAVSAFMVCVNELTDLKCHKKEILEPLLILLTPYAPHIAEELFHALNNKTTILDAAYPKLETKYLIESEKEYPVSINGKMRTTITISLDASQSDVEKIALENDIVQKWIEGKQPKKIIFVKNKMINVVV